jgi:hypothetical protein
MFTFVVERVVIPNEMAFTTVVSAKSILEELLIYTP